MPEAAAQLTQLDDADFAGVLAAVHWAQNHSANEPRPPARETNPNGQDEQSDDEFAALSYEAAVRAQSQRATAPPEPAVSHSAPAPARKSAGIGHHFATSAIRIVEAAHHKPRQGNIRSASIAIRLSPAESAQIHARAAEADLSVSAYLRSCVLEVEQLRSQVKQMVAELRSAPPDDPAPAPESNPPQPRSRWSLFSRRHFDGQPIARA